jgi:RND family efflux transporter MFP subunit
MNLQIASNRKSGTTIIAVPAKKTGLNNAFRVHEATPTRLPSRILAGLAVFVAGLGAAAYVWSQSATEAPVAPEAAAAPVRQVSVTMPERGASGAITLPATVQAYQATDLFARASGFLKVWNFDIGAKVKRGQVLAEIETPELDQELAQAIASLTQGEAEQQQAIAELEEAKSDVALAEANVAKVKAHFDFALNQVQRYARLISSKSVAREEYENVLRDHDSRQAELASAKAELSRRKTNIATRTAIIASRAAIVGNRKANVQRLRDLTGFQKVVAPFDGIVTRRNAEVGMLVTAGSNAGTRPLFSMAQTDVLRVQAAVPQSSALTIKPGDRADVLIPEKPGQAFTAKVSRTAGAVEPTSRSLLVEVELANHEGFLPPGVYAQVRFQAQKQVPNWVIPSKALQMRSSGPHVVIVGSDNRLRTRQISLGRDFGATVEVLVGLTGDERLVVNPSDDLRDGQQVQLAGNTSAPLHVARK